MKAGLVYGKLMCLSRAEMVADHGTPKPTTKNTASAARFREMLIELVGNTPRLRTLRVVRLAGDFFRDANDKHPTTLSHYQVSPPAFGGQAFRARRMVAIWPVW